MKEEEIRGKLLLPFLLNLGFSHSEISLEESFSIRLGKTMHKINGRADILCKRNGFNLFIIELKSDKVSIKEEDIEQGISYARLLENNIAPFTIVSNGKITRIFDTITRKELTGTNISEQSNYWKDDFTLSTDIDLNIRYEALKKFVAFSQGNLTLFCQNQLNNRIGPIIGTVNNPSAKFIKELYTKRQALQDNFDNFISSPIATVFGIIGKAGVGKTNSICHLALQQLNKEFVFFYNAAIHVKSPLKHIADDLNLVFSDRSENESVLKRLDELGKLLNKKIIIFIDAIDESTNMNLKVELSEIALSLRIYSSIKLCISCKSNTWGNFLKANDTPTHLYEELMKFHLKIPSLESTPGFLLEEFSDDELSSILPKYQKIFQLKGKINNSLLEAMRNGFFLRIFCEVYQNTIAPESVNNRNLINQYLKKSFDKTKVGYSKGIRILSKVSGIILNEKNDTIKDFDDSIEVVSASHF